MSKVTQSISKGARFKVNSLTIECVLLTPTVINTTSPTVIWRMDLIESRMKKMRPVKRLM